mmetsp:Transcript_125322/g.348709  ORF Transcript_125322/g.348709 Transcript_125322/m.348709 type:complete len:210 (-) Transcript_125322:114-743(-)
MAKKKNSRFIGSCGIYVFGGASGASPRVLVHRRSKQVSEPNTICAPGGIVERQLCGSDGSDFEAGARATAVRELLEETGIRLDADTIEGLAELPVGEGAYWGPDKHRNYFAMFEDVPSVSGPEKASKHEIVWNGMTGIGEPAGDGYHAWVDVHELLSRQDLMPGCRIPLAHFAQYMCPASAGDGPTEDTPECGPPPKRPRGSVGRMIEA